MALQLVKGTSGNDTIVLDANQPSSNPPGFDPTQPVNVSLLAGVDSVRIKDVTGAITVAATDAGDTVNVSGISTAALNITLGSSAARPDLINTVVVDGSRQGVNATAPVGVIGGGNTDVVTVDKVNGIVKALLAAGDDQLTVNSGNAVLQVDLGAGNDKITAGAKGTVTGSVALGTGNDEVVLEHTTGTVRVTSGDGGDKVTVKHASGDVGVVLGNTANPAFPSGALGPIIGGNLRTPERVDNLVLLTNDPGTATAKLSVTGGTGNDLVEVTAGAGNTLNLALGAGTDAAHIVGAASGIVDLGAGDDQIAVENAGNITVNLGTGLDIAQLSNLAGTASVVAADAGDKVVLNGLGGATNVTLGSSLTNLTLQNEVTVNGTRSNGNSVAPVTVNGSGNVDKVAINHVNGTITATLAGGDDTLVIEAGAVAMRVDLGAGNDKADVGVAGTATGSIALGTGLDQLNLTNTSGVTSVSTSDAGDKINVTHAVGTLSATLGGLTAAAPSVTDNNFALTNSSSDQAVNAKVTAGTANDFIDLNIGNKSTYTVTSGAGNDAVNVIGAASGTVDLGAGNDIARIAHGAATTVLLGTGHDTAEITNVAGAITVSSVDADDSISIDAGAGAINVTLGSSATNLALNNTLQINGSSSAGNATAPITVNGGTNADDVYISNVNGTVKGGLGGGNDSLHLIASASALQMDLGAGNDWAYSGHDGSVTGSLSLGTGLDNVRLENTTGILRVSSIDGGDRIRVDHAAGNLGITLGNAATALPTLDVGFDFEQFQLTAPSKLDNVVRVSAVDSDNTAKVAVTGGTGNDLVELFAGAPSANTVVTGAGDDIVHIAPNTAGGVYTANVDLGAGNDQLSLDSPIGGTVQLGLGHDLARFNGGQVTMNALDGGDAILAIGTGPFTGTGVSVINLGGNGGLIDSSATYLKDLPNAQGVNNYVAATDVDKMVINGNTGVDRVDVKFGRNITVSSGAGNDLLNVQGSGLTVKGGSGNDKITATLSGGQSNITGDDGNDRISVTGTAEGGVVSGGIGFDLITAKQTSGATIEGGADGSVQEKMVIALRAGEAGNTDPSVDILVDGTKIATQVVSNTQAKNYEFLFDSSALKTGRIDVKLTNSTNVPGNVPGGVPSGTSITRSVYVGDGSIRVNMPDAVGVQKVAGATGIYDRGVGLEATDGKDIVATSPQTDGTVGLAWNGTLRMQLASADTLKGDELTLESSVALLRRGEGVENLYGQAATIKTGTDIASDQLWFSKNSDGSYVVSVLGTSDKAVLHAGLASLQDKTGKLLDTAGLDRLVNAMAALPAPLSGQTTYTAAQHAALDTVLAASWH